MTNKIEMTDEVKAKMLGLFPMSADIAHSFTPKQYDDIPEEYQPVFKIKQFTNKQVTEIKAIMYKEMMDETKKKSKASILSDITGKTKEYLEITHQILVGWENLIEVNTAENIEYDGSIEMLSHIPEVIRTEIFKEALRITGFLDQGIV